VIAFQADGKDVIPSILLAFSKAINAVAISANIAPHMEAGPVVPRTIKVPSIRKAHALFARLSEFDQRRLPLFLERIRYGLVKSGSLYHCHNKDWPIAENKKFEFFFNLTIW
jgi:hypothetical protein